MRTRPRHRLLERGSPRRRATASIAVLTLLLPLAGCPQKTPPTGDGAQERADTTKTKSSDPGVAKTDAAPSTKRGKRRPVLPDLPNDVVATVQDQPIPRADFDALYEPGAKLLLERRGDGVIPEAYQASHRVKYIDQLIWSKLLALEAARTGVDYDPEALASQERDERADVRDWAGHLARIGQTEALRHKLNVDHLRERALLEAASGSLEPTEAELRAAYEASPERFQAAEPVVRASHLLLAFGPREPGEKILPAPRTERDAATPETLARWEAASLERARALRTAVTMPGVDFNQFARVYSEGPGAFRGGDMGLFPRTRMVKDYADAAFGLKVGEVSEPIKSDKGYYVIRLFGRYPAGPLPFEAVRPDLVRQVEASKYREARAALKAALDARYAVESAALDAAKAYRDAARGRARKGPAARVPEGTAAQKRQTANPGQTKGQSRPAPQSPTQR